MGKLRTPIRTTSRQTCSARRMAAWSIRIETSSFPIGTARAGSQNSPGAESEGWNHRPTVRKNSGYRSEKSLPHEGVGRTDNTPDVRLEDSFLLLLERAYKSSPGKTPFSRPAQPDRSRKRSTRSACESLGWESRLVGCARSRRELGLYSVVLRSAHSTRPTKIVGLPNLNLESVYCSSAHDFKEERR